MTNEILKEGITAFRSGDKAKAKQIFIEVLKSNPQSETAWLGLSRCVDNVDEKRFCLEKVLAVNPQNQTAIKNLEALKDTGKTDLEQLGSKSEESVRVRRPLSSKVEKGKETYSHRKNLDTTKTETQKENNKYWIIGSIIFLFLIIFIYGIWLIKNSTNHQALEIPTTVNVTDIKSTPSVLPDTGALAISDDWWEFQGGGSTGGLGDLVRVTGTIQNRSNLTVEKIKVIAEAYNAVGQKIGEGYDYISSNSLEPGDMSPYNFYFNVTDRPKSVKLSITYGLFQAQAPVIQIPTKTPYPTPTPLPIGSSVQVKGMYSILEFKVADILIIDTLKGIISSEDVTAAGRFAVIFLDVTNKGSSDEIISSVGFIPLANDSGQLFLSNSDASFNAAIQYGLDTQPIIHSGQTSKFVIVYDIPKEGDKYFFIPSGEIGFWSNSGLLVDIPTSNQILTPTPSLLQSALPAGSSVTIKEYSESWQVNVNKVIVASSITSTITGSMEKASGRFVIIFMNVTNTGNSPSSFYTSGRIKIKDASGIIYEDNFIATMYAQENYGTTGCSYINPGTTLSCVAVYDISINSEYYLLVPGEFNETKFPNVLIDVP